MNTLTKRMAVGVWFAAFALVVALPSELRAGIQGVEGNTFNLTADQSYLSIADGASVLFWGFGLQGDSTQYPGPTLIVQQGATVTINLTNNLTFPVSILFPGQSGVQASGGQAGLLTSEAAGMGGTVSYSFVAEQAGTYFYHSGTRQDLQVEMGLLGAIIVRPSGFDASAPRAYEHADSAYDQEVLFLMTEMDPRIHSLIELEGIEAIDGTDFLTNYTPNYWFLNGRSAPDTMADGGVPWLPAQPYNCMPMIQAGKKLLMRMISAGRDLHPFHHHGNHSRIIATDGRLLSSSPGAGADLSQLVFTIQSVPGQTADAIFQWTGKGLGWDVYGTGDDYAHDCQDMNGDDFDDMTSEYCPDHGKVFPVDLPGQQSLAFGGTYSGSPYLGAMGLLPPGEGGMNPSAGYAYMWHSHTEREMTNYDIFPGGMMTMLIVNAVGSSM